MLRSPGHDAPVVVIAPSPEGVRVAAADQGGRVLIHRFGEVVAVRCLDVGDNLAVVALAWTCDGRRLVIGTPSSLLVWEAVEDGGVLEIPLSSLGFDSTARLEDLACGDSDVAVALVRSSEAATLVEFDPAIGAPRWSAEVDGAPDAPLDVCSEGRAIRYGATGAQWRDLDTGQLLPDDAARVPEMFPTHGTSRGTTIAVRVDDRLETARLISGFHSVSQNMTHPSSTPSSEVGTDTAIAFARCGDADVLLIGTALHGVLVVGMSAFR